MRILIEDIYRQMNDISRLSTEEFSCDFLGMNPSYYRSIKSRNIEPSTGALMILMERLHQRANGIKAGGRSHQVLQKAADRYEDLAQLVAIEIAQRTIKRDQASVWVRKTLLKIISAMNEDRLNSVGSMPPIIIC